MAAQTFQAKYRQEAESIDYTPVGAVAGGAVVLFGGLPLPAKLPIPAGKTGALEMEGGFDVVKDASVFANGDPVYWNPTGDPVGGVAGSGACTSNGAGTYLMGCAILPALTGDATAAVKLLATNRSVAPSVPTATVAAAGSNQATAAPVATGFTLVTGADDAKGIKLPNAVAGLSVEIKNNTSAKNLLVYPFLGDAINAIAANGSYTMAGLTSAIFRCYDGTTWYTTPLVAS